ncbi:MAG: MinD/ParA family protein [Deltaproteobacteria bacterium]|nr:MAG: MinD/ParA family protein [Deltaproteobacteria bacterium]
MHLRLSRRGRPTSGHAGRGIRRCRELAPSLLRERGVASPPTPTAAPPPSGTPVVWAVGGGKGGVGKSFVSVHLSTACALAGRRVVLVDADLGGANLDTLLGCPRPAHDLGDFFAKRVATLDEACVTTDVPNLRLLAGDGDTLGAANPHHAQKLKLIRHLRRVEADLVVLDLGAGATFNVLDLFLAADERICVTQPEPTALQNAFAFLKAATLRSLEKHTGTKIRQRVDGSVRALSGGASPLKEKPVRLVVNRARPAEGRSVANALADLANRFLGLHVVLAGTVGDDLAVRGAVRQGRPLFLSHPASPAAADLRRIATSLLEPCRRTPSQVAMGINESLVVDGLTVHLQTEDLGEGQGAVVSQVFRNDGAVLYSRRTPYSDAFFVKLSVSPQDRARYHHAAIRRALATGRIQLPIRRTA